MKIGLNFKVLGQGEPIIILHGLFGSLDNWMTFAKKLATSYSVYLIDQRDHGKSPHTNSFSYPILAEDIVQFMDDQHIPKAHMLGHSMGGKTVMQIAANYPERIDKLIVVDIAPKYYAPRHTLVFDAIKGIDLAGLSSRMDAMQYMQSKLDDATAAFLTKNIRRTKQGAFVWKMNVPLLEASYEKISSAIFFDEPYEGKTLFVKGGDSGYIQDFDAAEIHEKFNHATIVRIDEAGHWIHAQKPEDLLLLVESFIK